MAEKTPFRKYYEEFCEVFGHPLWMMPMMIIGLFFMIELMHTKYHIEAGITVTAVTLAAITLPVAIVTDAELPDISPLIEIIDDES